MNRQQTTESEPEWKRPDGPGQCVHAWVPADDGLETCARGCGSTCRRDEDRKIERYSAGPALLRAWGRS